MQRTHVAGWVGHGMDRLVLFLLSQAIIYATQVLAAQPVPETIGSFQAWDASIYTEPSGEQVCYIVSMPRQSEPQDTRRGETYFMVTHEPTRDIKDAVTVAVGYPYQDDSSVEIRVGVDSFTLTTEEAFAWVADKDTLEPLIDAMIRGQNMTVSGTSAAGTRITDTYSLLGFTAARSAMFERCVP